MLIGVLAIQGDFIEHINILQTLGVECREIRLPEQLSDVDGLIIPGCESTTLSRLLTRYDLRQPIKKLATDGKPLWGTCAGMIMLASEITENDPVPLEIMDIGVQRNAFGRQIDSFEQELEITGFDETPYHAIFIRAPVIKRVGSGVSIMASLQDGRPVAVQQANLMATSFHPELTKDSRFHTHFLNLNSNRTVNKS